MKVIDIVKLCFIGLILLSRTASVKAIELSKEFEAVIAAPAEVQLAKTGAISIAISIRRLNDKLQKEPLPAKIQIWSSHGVFVDESTLMLDRLSPQPVEIDTPQSVQILTLLLTGFPTRQPSIRVDVTTTEEDFKLLGTTEIKLRRIGRLEFTEVTETIPADGKATGRISLRLTDQQGDPVDNVPFILRGSGPYGPENRYQEIVVAATTGKDGGAIFEVPASAWSGRALLQVQGRGVVTEQIATRQFEIHYEDDKFHGEKPIVEDWDWWKKPIILPYPPR